MSNNLRISNKGDLMIKLKAVTALTVTTLLMAGCTAVVEEQESQSSTTPEVVSSSDEAQPQTSSAAQPEVADEPEAATEPQSDESVAVQADEPMTDVDIVMVALMGPDGEYAAAASYLAVIEEYGAVEPYATIYEAELRHISALQRQLERLGVAVPENPYLGEIDAPSNLQAAAEAWAEGEILNVELYDNLLAATDDPQLTKVLGNLRRASLESHLPAFESAALAGGSLDNFTGGH